MYAGVRATHTPAAERKLDKAEPVWNNDSMARDRESKSMTELLREAINEADSLLGLERETKLKRAALRRFRDGKQSLRLDLADKLAEYFGIECRRIRRPKG